MNGRSSEAGIKFLIIGAISSALLLYGMALDIRLHRQHPTLRTYPRP